MKERLQGLYAITDEHCSPGLLLFEHAEQALRGGTRILQYRNKHGSPQTRLEEALELRSLCHEHDATFIINDDVALSARIAADGVHIGTEDAPLEQAREALGPEAIIGLSCYDQFPLAVQAQAAGADYIAFGRVYPSRTKPGATRAPLSLFMQGRSLALPVCAIGGITPENASPVIEAGADMLAVIQGLFGSADIELAARSLASLFQPESGV